MTGAIIYDKILRDLFQTSGRGGHLVLERVKGDTGEILLKVSNSTVYFGEINVSGASELCTSLAKNGELTELLEVRAEGNTALPMFDSIKNSDSTINLLIGAKKFAEGWDCWRVSVLGLLNVGKTEGTQIIQLFGRGVRLSEKNIASLMIISEDKRLSMISRNYAGIDMGSNSCKLLICDEKGNALCLKNYPTRLAEGMYKENKIMPEAFERGLQCFFECRQLLDKYGVEPHNLRAVATAACRMALNGGDFVKKIYDESHIRLEIIDGLEEALLNLKGAAEHVKGKSKYVVVYDLGGGSTEVTLATNTAVPDIICSISIP